MIPKRNRSAVNRRARQNKRSGGRSSQMAPPQIRSNIEFRHKYRFVSTSAAATAITPTSLLGAAGTVGKVAATSVVTICESVKVNSLEMWCPPAAQGAAATCSVDWVGYQNSPNREYSDTTVSVAQPAHVRCSPPAQSLASFWQIASGTTLCVLTAPIGTIIDVDLSCILQDDENGSNTINVATATVGLSYYLSLDGPATNLYPPVSLTSTH